LNERNSSNHFISVGNGPGDSIRTYLFEEGVAQYIGIPASGEAIVVGARDDANLEKLINKVGLPRL